MNAQKQYDELVQSGINQLRVFTGGKGILSHFTNDFSPSQPDFKVKCLASLKQIVTRQKELGKFVEDGTTGMVPYSRPVIEQCLAQMIVFETEMQKSALLYLNYEWFAEHYKQAVQLTTNAINTSDLVHHFVANAYGQNMPAPKAPYDLDGTDTLSPHEKIAAGGDKPI